MSEIIKEHAEKQPENILTTIDALFQKYCFKIPQYQRSYAWEEKQLEAFVEDLRHQISAQKGTAREDAKKPYFLGTLLLHADKDGVSLNVVDGQQRLTTTVIFIAAALQLAPEVHDSDAVFSAYIKHPEHEQKFITIDKDNAFFRSAILFIDKAVNFSDSLSSKKLLFARNYFKKNIEDGEWSEMVDVLRDAQVLAYVVDNISTATQIFEFQNDRGKSLTNLETLKSYLMHNVHLHTVGDSEKKLNAMQQNFEEIFRCIEELANYPRSPKEDSILSYHCAAYLKWSNDEYQRPKQQVKYVINKMDLDGSVAIVDWIDEFIASLKASYFCVLHLYKKIDDYTEFSHLLVLNRLASFWPLMIKCFRADSSVDKKMFRKSCRLMEIFTFRAHGLANLRSDGGHSHLTWMAREFNENFEWIYSELKRLSHEWDIDRRISDTLNNANFYHSETNEALYILWRYENYLRRGEKHHNQWAKISWREIVLPKNHAEKLSLEHIAAQNNAISSTLVSWKDEPEDEFKKVALHRLGNLVLDSISSNSSKQDNNFEDKWIRFTQSSTYLSQGELKSYLVNDTWDVDAIKKRQECLIRFIQKEWNPEEI